MALVKSRAGTWLLWIFVLSGFSGLIYQSIWTQYLGLFLGHSSYAQSLVLILFMGGMAIGAWLVSRWSSRVRRPLLAYAIIEVVIGLLGLSFDGIYQGLTGWAYDQLLPMLPASQLQHARWVLAAAMVLPQCILLGATFPLMSAGYIRLREHAEGRVLAGLYFSNSLGAAIGALASTYVMLPAIGMPGTVFSAGLINILVAVMVYPLSKRDVSLPASGRAASEPQGEFTESIAPSSGRATSPPLLILAVAGLTGAASFVYEITWIRMLSLALGTTIHSFELMLAAFILGIAMGGLWLKNRADSLLSPLVTAGWIQVWMGIAALGSMFVYASAFEWVGWLMKVITHTAEGYGLFNLASAGIALLVMFPAAFFAGMTLPLLTLALLRQGHGEKSIGQAYAYNTIGAIVGVLAAVHVLMPLLGLKFALLSAAMVDIALGLVLLAKFARSETASRAPVVFPAAAISALAVVASAWLVTFDPLVLNSSVYRHGTTVLGGGTRTMFVKDGKTATVAAFETGEKGQEVRMISTNGKVDAGMAASLGQAATADESTMLLLAAVPLSMRDHYDRIGVIGFGSGLTTHTLMGHAKVGSVDTVEIEPAMVEGARAFGSRVSRAYTDPRSNVIIDDAKAYFASVPQKYDLIISEPSNPWVGGTASLFGTEFYQYIPKQLNEDGLFVQWLQLYEISPDLVNSVLSAMLANFKDVKAYIANENDLILVASPHGEVPELGGSIFEQPLLAAELSRIGVTDLAALQSTQVMNRTGLQGYLTLYPYRLNSDMYPILKLQAPQARFERAQVTDFAALGAAPWPVSRWLGGASPRSGPLPEGIARLGLVSSRQTEAAHEVFATLVEGSKAPTKSMSDLDDLQVDALRGFASTCDLDSRPQRSATLIFSLAAETTAHLDPARLERLWGKPEWLRCSVEDETVRAALDFVAAVSEGRNVDVIRTGLSLFDGPHGKNLVRDPVSGPYIMGSMQYAALAEGDSTTAKQLLQRYWLNLDSKAQANSSLRLLAWLAMRPAETRVQ
ncbi:spermine synthase [Stenotrophomonas sp. SORGH_AS_0282]|jgi:predicted membrane-bound spermidine synthase|uniref:spermine/spermidine synthase domain-containing protein n=1 Tax=Stenotrophomonas sp. SORGH_AS_0282 TaxID=3041763 RepID=UPI002783FA2C|nr:spermine synthase [Stenotrophomonas sp. SORGH_AS_0282]MDQ1061690.1 spermidine synthase [Stenotrophomonas sp. SORGH_AS_0282]MDQ1189959.1 spermidine synthase [Stenotrophomonas sp. SORGH_AS_0282]